MRRIRLAVVGAGLVGSLAVSALAGTIVGTAKNDVLTGTAKADKLYGKQGNDKEYGLGGNDFLSGGPGNDVLVGGPGADVLSCGPGQDTAIADALDKVGKDCEVVKGLPKPPPSPSPPAGPTHPGLYVGTTSQGKVLSFVVRGDGVTLNNFATTADATCPGEVVVTLQDVPVTFGAITIAPDRSFGASYLSATPFGPFTETVHGSFDAAGNGTGTLQIDGTFGVTPCSSGGVTWTA